jgi:hypothetical protein
VAVERVDAVAGTQGFVYAEDLTQAAASSVSLDVTWNGTESAAGVAIALGERGAGATAPANTAVPVVSGSAQVGSVLTVSDGTWSGSAPMSFAYQWRRCDASGGACADIAGGTSSHVVSEADAGSTLRAVVTASNGAGSAPATSAQTAVVTGPQPPVNSVLPVVSGLAQVGSVLAVSDGSWSGSAPLSFAYRWQRCVGGSCVDVGGASGSSYAVGSGDVGSSLRVGVRASNGVGSSEVFSAETGVVVSAPVSPVFVGSVTQGVGSSSFVVPRPVGVEAGDVLVGWVATDSTHVVVSVPAGWVQVGSTQDDGSDSSVSVFWRVVQPSDPASWSGLFGSSEAGVVGVVAYRGVDQASPVDVVAQGRSGSGVVSSTPSVTPSGSGRVVLGLFGGDPGSGSRSGEPDTDPVAVERVDAVAGTQGFVYAEDLTQAAASSVSLDVTWNGSDSSASFILALRAVSG